MHTASAITELQSPDKIFPEWKAEKPRLLNPQFVVFKKKSTHKFKTTETLEVWKLTQVLYVWIQRHVSNRHFQNDGILPEGWRGSTVFWGIILGTLHLLAKLISRSYCAVDTPWDVEIERQRLESKRCLCPWKHLPNEFSEDNNLLFEIIRNILTGTIPEEHLKVSGNLRWDDSGKLQRFTRSYL